MCELTHYRFCVKSPDKELPTSKLIRCREWPQIESNARRGGTAARNQFRNHITGKLLITVLQIREDNDYTETHDNAQTKVEHVSTILIGGTCVPDASDKQYARTQSTATDM